MMEREVQHLQEQHDGLVAAIMTLIFSLMSLSFSFEAVPECDVELLPDEFVSLRCHHHAVPECDVELLPDEFVLQL